MATLLGYYRLRLKHRSDEALMEYYVLLVEKNGDAIARVIGSAPTSSAARDLAQDLDVKLNGRITGRTFYLDHEALIAWRTRGKVAPIGPLIPEIN